MGIPAEKYTSTINYDISNLYATKLRGFVL